MVWRLPREVGELRGELAGAAVEVGARRHAP